MGKTLKLNSTEDFKHLIFNEPVITFSPITNQSLLLFIPDCEIWSNVGVFSREFVRNGIQPGNHTE